MEKNNALTDKVRILKIEQKFQSVLLSKVNEQKKKAGGKKVMIEDEKKNTNQQIGREDIKCAKAY